MRAVTYRAWEKEQKRIHWLTLPFRGLYQIKGDLCEMSSNLTRVCSWENTAQVSKGKVEVKVVFMFHRGILIRSAANDVNAQCFISAVEENHENRRLVFCFFFRWHKVAWDHGSCSLHRKQPPESVAGMSLEKIFHLCTSGSVILKSVWVCWMGCPEIRSVLI